MGGNNFQSGEVIYKYQLQARIGGGEFGEVWLAYDRSIASLVAIKLLDAKTASVDERLHEAQIGNKLNHPNLVKVHYADVVNYQNTPYVIIAMDYHSKGSVTGQLNAGNFMPIPQVVGYIAGVLRGLEYLHDQNMFHNDIKPSNILLGSQSEAILTDYGITCFSPDAQPVHPTNFYRLHVAPETLINDQVSISSDIYQTGITAFRLLNGIGLIRNKLSRLNSWSDYYELVKKGIISGKKDYQPFIPRSLKMVINRAIDPNPTKRYPSCLDFRRALERMSFPGSWSCDSTGRFIGEDNLNYFHFEICPSGYQKSDFLALKTSKKTGRVQKISAFSAYGLSEKELSARRTDFMQSVVIGRVDKKYGQY